MPDYRLTITLHEPFTCSSVPVISNEIHTLDFIPATVLRGALAASLSYLDRQSELAAWFGTAGPRWTAALPISPKGAIVPMPLCFVADKKDKPFNGRFCTLNTFLVSQPLPENSPEYSECTSEPLNEHHHFQWVGIRSPWLRLDENGKPFEAYKVELDSSMHVGLHYGRQSARDGALFSRREIPAGTRLQAWVQDPNSVLTEMPDFLFLGKRRSAGNGAASLSSEPMPMPWAVAPTLQPGQTEVTIQLMSDALVPDPASGSWLRGLDAAFWTRTLKQSITVTAKASANRPALGWSSTWDLPRSQALAIVAGSVYRLKTAEPDLLPASLAQLAAQGIGVRRHEGFGRIAVNPGWLQDPITHHKETEPPKPVATVANAWPGLEAQPIADIYDIARAAQRAAAGLKKYATQLGALSAYAARAKDPTEIIAFADSFAHRVNPRGWDVIFPAVKSILSDTQNIHQARFALDAIETYLKD